MEGHSKKQTRRLEYFGCLIRSRNFLPFASTWVHPRFDDGVRVAQIFSVLCCPIMCIYILSSVCDVRDDFRIQTMFGSSLPPVVGELMSYLLYLCLLAHRGVQYILCCVFVLFVFVLCTLCYKFHWNVHFCLTLRYSLTLI